MFLKVSYLPVCLVIYLFIYVIVANYNYLKSSAIQVIPCILQSHKFHEINSHISRYIFKAHLIVYFYPRASDPFHLFSCTKNSEYNSVQSNTCYMHRPSHPLVHSAVRNMNLLIAMLHFLNCSTLHPRICLCKRMSPDVITLYNLDLNN
jgi:hypothetical protein